MIKGLDGREPLGAALSVGHKGSRGNPQETDQFFIVSPREGDDKRRPMLPAFDKFNRHPDKATRSKVLGNLVHASKGDCFEYNLRAQVNPKGQMHPDRRPWCTGDGEKANRWIGPQAQDFRSIVCPNEQCEFRQSIENRPPPCRPFMRLLFRLRWPDGNPLPTPTVKYTSMGWLTITGAIGLFEALERAQHQIGVRDCPLYGYPIMLTLSMRTQPSKNRRYPVVDITGEMDPVEWTLHQQGRIKQLSSFEPQPALEDMRDDSDDWQLVNPGPVSVPGPS